MTKQVLKIGFILLAVLLLGGSLLLYLRLFGKEAVEVNSFHPLPEYKVASDIKYGKYCLWSPKGNRIGFVMAGNLYTVTLDGEKKNYIGKASNYLWLPDGRILYKERETWDLWISDAEGKEKIRLTDGYKKSHHWLPGKKGYLFNLVKDEKTKEEIRKYLNSYGGSFSFSHKTKKYTLKKNTSLELEIKIGENEITEQLATGYKLEYNWLHRKEDYLWKVIGNNEQKRIRVERLLYEEIVDLWGPQWGYKRERLVFWTKGRRHNDLWLLDITTKELVKVARNVRPVITHATDDPIVIFSPDEDHLLFLKEQSPTRNTLYLYNIKKKEKTSLCKYYDYKGGGYCWFPDGTRFAYSVRVPTYDPHYTIYSGIAVSNIITGKTTIYKVKTDVEALYMDFSPDGKQLAFFSSRDNNSLWIGTLEE